MTPPPLTIGMPAMNGGETIGAALESILGQTRGDFRVLVADNASTDDTGDIARSFAARDARVTVVRRPERLSAARNFAALVDSTDTPYFMFAPVDDHWHREFVAAALGMIEADPEASLVCPMVEFETASGERIRPGGTYAISGAPTERLRTYLGSPGCNSRFYGIHRTAALRAAFDGIDDIVGWDWLLMAKSLLAGPHREIGKVLMTRALTPRSAYHRLVERSEPDRLNRALPGLTLSRQLLRSLPRSARWKVMPALAKMNFLMLQGSPYRLSRAIYWSVRTPVQTLVGRPARIG